MNHIYRSIWNQATGAYAAVSENVKSAGKRSLPGASGGGAHFALTSMAAALMLGYGSLALAGPTGGNVVAGQATINGAPGSTVINQGSQNAVINWASFNIGQGESVQFKQPNSNAVALNRVLGSDGTSILGNLSANGKVFIVNPNGILFGQGASVNTAGLVASTLDISNNDFMSGKYQFSGNGTGKVLNQGSISAPGGYVALLGANVSNEGTIQARLGSVALAAGRAITLDVAGDGLLNVAINEGAVGALVNNGGLIKADGGSVLLSAQAAGDLLKTVVNNTGIIEAHTIDTRGGTIKLLGDMQSGTVNAAGTLDASAPTGGNGGFIDTSAAHVKLDDGLKVTTAAAKGLAGTWLIDPTDYNIAASGGDQTGAFFSNMLKSSNVQIQSVSGGSGTQGNINVNDTISWSANKLTLTAQNNININTAMRGSGTASLALEYGQSSAAGTGSTYNVKAAVDLPSGNNFSTKQGSSGPVITYQVINSLGAQGSLTGNDLQGINGALGGNYVLGSNIDATLTAGWGGGGFVPIGSGVQFSGRFDGLGHVVNNLYVNRQEANVGLFGSIGSTGSVSNLGLIGANITGAAGSYLGAGALAGENFGQINNTYSSGNVSGSNITTSGGLVGLNYGSISNSRSSATVVSAGFYGAGGLVGNNALSGNITNSSATGAVNSDATGSAGGLVAFNFGTVSSSFATGAVTGGQMAGGLIGYNRYDAVSGAKGIVQYSYATGAVTGHSQIGGLVGQNVSGTISNSYSTSGVTGTAGPAGSNLSGDKVGGLVGFNQSGGLVLNSYATGNVSGVSNVGGVVGWNDSTTGGSANGRSSLTNVYSSGKVTGASNVGGVAGQNQAPNGIVNGIYNTTLNAGSAIGLNTGTATFTGLSSTQMKSASNFTGFNFTTSAGATGNNWVMVNTDGSFNSTTGTGATLPMLASEWSNTISSAHQLQLMGMSLTAQYVLANDIAAATTASSTLDVWNGGSFIPVGTSGATPFAGRFDGAGHTIYGLVVNRSGIDYAGLFGATASNAYIANVGLEGGSITGKNYTGALVGSNAGTVNGSFSTVSVTGASQVGGLVGYSSGTVSNNYASGAVSGTDSSGGLVGANAGTLTNNYANGVVSGTSNAGGLAGTNSGASSGNFWDSIASGKASSATGTGLSTAQLKTLSIFSAAGWDLGGTWIVYDGNSTPLLRSFMTPLYVNFNGTASKTYDGTNSWTAPTYTYSTLTDSRLQGTLNYGAAGSAINAGTYAITAGGLYSGQHGYVISNNAATLTIAQLGVSLSGATVINRAYDGTTNASLSGGSLSGVLAQDLGNVQFNTGVFASQNAGNGIAVTAVGTGSAGGNYVITASGSLTGNITPKALTVSGLSVASKQYDGNTGATFTGGSLNGLVGNETLSLANLAGTYADANAGTGKAVAVNPNTLSNGTGLASNYTLTAPTGIVGAITPRVLTISGMTAANKIYDATTDAFLFGGSLSNLVNGETLGFSGSTGVFSDKNVGNGKSVTVSGTTLQNGTGLASNYTISNPTNVTANISKATVSSVSGILAGNKVYDGTVAASLNAAGASFAGMVGGDNLTVSSASGSFSDKNAGNGKTVNISGLALGGADAGNYNLTNTTASSTADISKASITGVNGLVAGNKVYDGSTAASLNTAGASFAGMVGGDNLTLSNASASFSDKNAGNGKTVNVSGIVLGGTDAGNYNLASNTANTTANISKASIASVSGIAAGNKVYDGSVTANLNTTGASFSGMVLGDNLTVSNASGSFSDKNAGSGKTVSISGIALGGTDAGNYSLTTTTASSIADISKATISGVSGLIAGNKVYDGTLGASLNVAGASFAGMVGGDNLTVSNASGSFSDKNAGNGKTVNISGIALGGTDSGNYNLASDMSSSTANISAKTLTLTGVNGNKVYDGTRDVTLAGGTLNGLVGSETLGLTAQGSYNDKNVGTNKPISVNGVTLSNGTGLASNYTVAAPSGVTGTITKASISNVTGLTALDKVYNGNLNVSLSPASAVINGKIAGDDVQLFSASGAFTDKNVGSNKTVNIAGITLSGSDLGNYNFINNTATATASITPKAVTLSGVTAGNKVYDGTTAAVLSGGNLIGVVSGETLNFSGGVGTFSDKNVGTGKVVTINGTVLQDGTGLASNYSFTSPGNLTANISKATINSVTSVGVNNKTYDGLTTATLTGAANFDGMMKGDSLTVAGSGAFSDKNAGTGKTVAASGITLTGTDAGNYILSNNKSSGTADIGKATINSVTSVGVNNKTYDGLTTATLTGAGTFDGMMKGDSLTVAGSGAFSDKNAGTGKTVAASGITLTGTDAGNYILANNASSGTADIGKATINSVTSVGVNNKTYDGLTTATLNGAATFDGMMKGDSLTVAGSGAFSDKNAGTGKTVAASGITLTGTDAGNYILANNASSGTADIGKATINSVTSVGVNNKTYDGLTTATLTGAATFDGMVKGDSLTVAGSGAFSDKNAGTGKTVAASGITLTGTDAGNYILSNNKSSGTADIGKATINSVTSVGVNNKTYDGLTTATLTGAATFDGMMKGDSLTVAGSGAFSDKNAGTNKAVAASGITLTGTDAGNYILANNASSGTADIGKATINSVTSVGVNNKTYDGLTTATLTGAATFDGMLKGDSLTVAGSGAFSDKNAGTGKAVAASGITLTGTDAGNYILSNNKSSGTADIGKATINSVTSVGVNNKTYDGLTTATLTGAGTFDGMMKGDSLTVAGSGAFSDKNAGTGKTVAASNITLSGADAGNYILANNASSGTADISKATINSVGGILAGNKVYDGNATASLNAGSASFDGIIGNDNLTVANASGSFSDKNAATGKTVSISGITLGGADAGNYNLASTNASTTADISKATISSVGGILASNKVYDGGTAASLNAGSASFAGIIGNDNLTVANASGSFSDKNAATGKTVSISGIALGGADAGNYNLASTNASTTADISKATINSVGGILASNKVYDGNATASLNAGSASFAGVIGNDNLTVANASGSFSDKNAANGKAVSISGITLGGADAGNYNLANTTAATTASITPKALTVVGQVAGNKVYDGNTVAQLVGGSLSGLVGSETLSIGGQTAAFSDKNAANAKTVTVSGTTLLDAGNGTTAGSASNYTVTNPTGLTASITPKALTVIGQVAGNKVYDGNTMAQLTGGSLSGLVGSETLSIGGQTAAFSDKNAANAKTVTVSGTTLLDGSGSASNYTVSNPTGLTASITPKVLAVIGQVASNKVYDGNTVAQLSGGSLIGLVGDETLSIGGQTANFGDKNAGNAKTVTVSGTTLLDGSGSASNYTVTNPTGLTASITPKALTVIGQVANNKVYDGNTVAQLIGGSLSGLVGSETLSIGGQVAAFSDKNAANAKTVTVSGTTLLDAGSGTTAGSASNYTVSNPTGLTASITPASISGISGIVAANKVYDGSTAASLNLSGASFNGMVAGDALSLAGGPVRGAFSDKNAATGKIVTISGLGLGGADAGNYILASNQAITTASISQAALTVKVDNAEKDQGRVNPPFSASYSGLVAGDTLASEVSGNLLFSTPATTGSPAGNYLVSASGQASNNYALNYVDGVLKVNPTEALQSAIASVIATIAVAPSQGNMVQADMIASGDTGPAAPGATAEKHADSNAPVVQLSGNVISNVLPGLRLSVVNNGLRLPIDVAAGVSQDSQ
ncbi:MULTISPECIES: YDG domain-containing protein [unclassified Janthinobacterium]|uniref:YDG domain-containing protein n=1 Tax=unclassified Janthinobacterium TaxID=2610881 RepID=UPI00160A7D89|nr:MULTISPECIES: YDG domain-containing protein [unclassified Janthinobacterium]MBB5369149.1 filamentous hemagglutinin family protein [Janthinobacterium sp. K2C7]MBB5381314.1 filamentous hemagglutinin family protein [Janthinobacterium sp. K2Li3]MBB5387532.1 filamentous hemagglutinin family protein [Janthinobacterium sp. K2E3]